MSARNRWQLLLAVLCVVPIHAGAPEIDPARKVILTRVPNGGIQPQVAVDAAGVVHMVYYKGDPGHGDLYYARSSDGGATFSTPMQVNSQPGAAVSAGNIRGAHIALGKTVEKKVRVHVAWNGSHSAAGKMGKEPMWYTRINDADTAFEAERNVIQMAYGLDGGGSLAADNAGNVYVVWHAPAPGTEGEGNRRVWIARSTDDGAKFEREKPVWDRATGACGCCGLNAFADRKGTVYVLYRSATEVVHRDMYLMVSKDHGQSFEGTDVSAWNVGACVMSSEAFAQGPVGVLAAWETEKQAYYGRVDPATGKMSTPVAAPGAGENRKHPAVAANAQGETLLAWTEGMGWKKGGSLSWQIYDKSGQPTAEHGNVAGVPVWSLVAAFARPDGGFTIVY